MTLADERKAKRTRELKIAVALGTSQWGADAAREILPTFAHELGKCDAPNISSLARASGITRQWVSATLNMRSPGHAVRRRLEDHLELTIGGMTDVLSVLEEL